MEGMIQDPSIRMGTRTQGTATGKTGNTTTPKKLTRDLSWKWGGGNRVGGGGEGWCQRQPRRLRGTDLNVAKRRAVGRLSSCSREGGSQMGGGENTQEHRKVEAVGVG